MEIAEVNVEIHFLIRLPDYLKEKQEELDSIDELIKLPVMKIDELGFLTIDCPTTHEQALYIYGKRAGIEKEMERAKNKAKRLVRAINSLDESDKRRLIDYYSNGKKGDVQAILRQINEVYTKEKEKELNIQEIHWREQVQERAKKLKEQLESGL